MFSTAFILSLLSLIIGPLLFRVARSNKYALSGLDGYIFLALPGILLFIMVPELVEAGGETAFFFAGIGLASPFVLELLNKKISRRFDRLSAGLGILGLVAHTIIEGSALSLNHNPSERYALSFQAMVVLHRLPVGLFVWWMLHPLLGRRAALAGLASLLLGTTVGYMAASQVELFFSAAGWSYFQAFVAGSLIHVVVHHRLYKSNSAHQEHHVHEPAGAHHHCHEHVHPEGLFAGYQSRETAAAIGSLLGLATILVLLSMGGHHHGAEQQDHHSSPFIETLVTLALVSAPALFLGYFFSGLLDEFMPQGYLRFLRSGSKVQQSIRGVVVGLPMPICSCGVIPLYYRLIQKGVPPAAAIAFLIATPELGIDAFLLSFPLLGFEMTFTRLIAAGILALAVAILMGRVMVQTPISADEHVHETTRPLRERIQRALFSGFRENVDHTGPWLLLGLIVAASVQPLFAAISDNLPGGALQVVAFSLLGIPFYVCAAGATPIVAVMLASGVSPGAALAFLLIGPATNLTTFGTLSQLHGAKAAWIFSVSMAGLAIVMGLTVNSVMPSVDIPLMTGHDHESEWWQTITLAIVGVAFVNSLLIQGPRGFARNLLPEKFSLAHK